MMEEQSNWIEQLKVMQSNIVSLFQGVIKERNNYKEGNDFLTATLRQMIGRIDNLERQNEVLQKCNANLRNIFGVGLKTLRKLDLSCENSVKDNKVSLELLQKLFLESGGEIDLKNERIEKTEFSSVVGERNAEIDATMIELKEEIIKVRKFGFESSKIQTQVNIDDEAGGNKKVQQLESDCHEETLMDPTWKKPQSGNDVKRKLMQQADASNSEPAEVLKPAEPPPETSGNISRSPVFKDARRQDAARTEENKSYKPALKLINEKFVEKSAQLLISSWKPLQSDGSSSSRGQITPKRSKNDSKFISPNRSPSTSFRRSNSRDSEAGSSAGKKLMQTFLNIDSFKRRSPISIKNFRSEEDERSKRIRVGKTDDDDLILDSPKRDNQLFEHKKEDKNENESRCLDETFISSPVLRQFNLGRQIVEEVVRNQSTHHREKSPEYDSVPFVYKREPVRKKEERMKLPGHPCNECEKYYKHALGDLDANDLKRILNKCSRHRDKNPPSLDDTPPGYWKPFLTCSTVFSPNKDDAR